MSTPSKSEQTHHEEILHSLRELAEHFKGDASDKSHKAASALSHAAADLLESLRAQTGPAVKSASDAVRSHPASTAALVAAAVGLIGLAVAQASRHRD